MHWKKLYTYLFKIIFDSSLVFHIHIHKPGVPGLKQYLRSVTKQLIYCFPEISLHAANPGWFVLISQIFDRMSPLTYLGIINTVKKNIDYFWSKDTIKGWVANWCNLNSGLTHLVSMHCLETRKQDIFLLFTSFPQNIITLW